MAMRSQSCAVAPPLHQFSAMGRAVLCNGIFAHVVCFITLTDWASATTNPVHYAFFCAVLGTVLY